MKEELPDLTKYWEQIKQYENWRSNGYRDIYKPQPINHEVNGNSIDYKPSSTYGRYQRNSPANRMNFKKTAPVYREPEYEEPEYKEPEELVYPDEKKNVEVPNVNSLLYIPPQSRVAKSNGIKPELLPDGWQLRENNPNYAICQMNNYQVPVRLTVRRDGQWWVAIQVNNNWETIAKAWQGNVVDALKKVSDYKKIIFENSGIVLKKKT